MNEELLKKKGTLRTKETEAKYTALKEAGHLQDSCPLCNAETLAEFTYWRIIPNRFPYDLIASVHHMLVPKRHTAGEDYKEEEIAELLELRTGFLNDNYQYIFEALANSKTVPAHFHFHLLISK